MLYLRLLLFFAVVFSTHTISAQGLAGRITDKKTGETLAFVSVVEKGTVNGTYSDIDGIYNLVLSKTDCDITFHIVGYDNQTIRWQGETALDVQLVPKDNLLSEVTIRPDVNPAERIIRKCIENKKKNNPESDIAFTYDSYNKLVFGGVIDSSVMANKEKFAQLDSNSQNAYNFLNSQYLFLMESATTRKFFPPDKSEETIIANRVSGLKMTDLFLLGTQLQSFSFYGETVDLLGAKYMSPLANNSINKYLFIIEDTTFIGSDTIFHISFQPRNNKNFDGMKGSLFINTNCFAIQNVIAEPDEVSGFKIKIQQQYEFLEGRKWFPKQLNSNISFDNITGPIPMTGEGRSYIKNVKLDAEIAKNEFTPVTLLMAKGAGNQPDSVWNKYRERELDTKEIRTYEFIDSLGKAQNLDRKVKIFEALATGILPLGPVGIDLRKLFRYNAYEKYRLGLGLRTSNLLSEKFSAGAYYAYGFGDKHSKYGGDLLIHLYRKRNAWMKMEYSNDVMETGGNQFDIQAESLSGISLYPLFINQMDRREKIEFSLHSRVIRNISATTFMNHQFARAYDSYRFIQSYSEGVNLYFRDYQVSEAGITIRYAPGEKLVRTTNREVRLGGRFPVLFMRYTGGFRDLYNGDFNYTRIDARVDKVFKILNVGNFSTSVIAGYSPDDIPLSFLYNARGSWDDFTIATPGAFETMRTNEFRHSEFVAVHLRHNFLDLLFQAGKFRPHFVLVHNMMWGLMRHKQSHNYELKDAQKGYYESGVQIDNLLVSNFSGIGVGAFYRYGPYHLPDMRQNFAFKITSSLVF
jgi:hypothetical protein